MSPSATILVVDDDRAVRESLDRALRLEGYAVRLAASGREAFEAFGGVDGAADPDLVVLDVMMPPPDGLEVCRTLRTSGIDVPVLMLTARDAVGDRVDGLDAGADDYLVKPFALGELLARIRALLRRLGAPSGEPLRFADLVLDPDAISVRRGDRDLEVTRTEFRLLETFLRNPRQVLSREQLIDAVWGYDGPATANAVEVYVGYVRRKLEAGGEPRLIQTVRGFGYALREAG